MMILIGKLVGLFELLMELICDFGFDLDLLFLVCFFLISLVIVLGDISKIFIVVLVILMNFRFYLFYYIVVCIFIFYFFIYNF